MLSRMEYRKTFLKGKNTRIIGTNADMASNLKMCVVLNCVIMLTNPPNDGRVSPYRTPPHWE